MSSYSEGQTHQLMNSLERAGFTAGEITTLGQMQYDDLGAFCGVLRGTHVIKMIEHIVNLNGPAQLPFDGAVLKVHRGEGVVKIERRGGDLYLDGKKIVLYRSNKQKRSGHIYGHDLRLELEDRGGNVSAVVLDYLVDHPQLWPEAWKKDDRGNTLKILFWDDVFRLPSHGHLYVRHGYWHEGKVVSGYRWLIDKIGSTNPAASLKA